MKMTRIYLCCMPDLRQGTSRCCLLPARHYVKEKKQLPRQKVLPDTG
jgi:hypothetical protein